jgi:hypothetical protein
MTRRPAAPSRAIAAAWSLAAAVLVVVQASTSAPLRAVAPSAAQASDASGANAAGRIAGTVVDGERHPVANALVTLTGEGVGTGRATLTSVEGAFVFDRLPAGRFVLRSSKPAYIASSFGATQVGGAGTAVALASGQQIADAILVMAHGGAISGAIRDAHGDPLPNLPVSVTPSDGPVAARVITDDRGAYRAYGLAPGRYVVSAAPGASGGIGEVGMMSSAEVDAALAALRQRSNPGSTPEVTPASAPTSVVRPTRTFNPAPIFFPGVSIPAAATEIVLGAGEDRTGVDFVYQLVPTRVVAGSIAGAGSLPVTISLRAAGARPVPGFASGGAMMTLQPRPAGDGPFMFTGVLPGRYLVSAGTAGSSAEALRVAQLVGLGALPASRAPAAATGPRL